MTSQLEMGERDELAETYNSIYLNQDTFDCGLLSAGGVLSVVDNVLQDARAGLAIVRPPGHHAEEVTAHTLKKTLMTACSRDFERCLAAANTSLAAAKSSLAIAKSHQNKILIEVESYSEFTDGVVLS